MNMLSVRTVLYFIFLVSGLKQIELSCQTKYTFKDSAKIYSFLEQADELDFRGKLDSAYQIIEKSIQNCKQINFQRGYGFSLLKKADILLKKADYKEIQKLLKEAYQQGHILKDSLIMGLSHHQNSQYHRNLSEYQDAIDELLTALSIYSTKSQPEYVGMCYNDLGFLYDKTGDYSKSIQNYLKALELLTEQNDEKEIANTYVNLAVEHFRIHENRTAINLFLKALSIQERIGDIKRISACLGNLVTIYSQISIDTALKYQERAMQVAMQTNIKSSIAQANLNYALLLGKQSKYQEAYDKYMEAIDLFKEIGDQGKINSVYLQCVDLTDRMGDSLLAENFLQKAFQIASKQQSKPMLQSYYFTASNFYQKHLNFEKANPLLINNYIYKDSLIDEKTKTNIAELNLKYQTEKKEHQLAELTVEQHKTEFMLEQQKKQIRISSLINIKNKQDIQILENEKQISQAQFQAINAEHAKQELLNKNQEQNILILEQEKVLKERTIQRQKNLTAFIILVLLLAILLTWLLFNRYKLKKKIDEQNQLFNISNSIARDLHDDIGSTLTSINILSKVSRDIIEVDPVQSRQLLTDISFQSKTVQQNMSDIVWAIRPDNEKLEALSGRMQEIAAKTLELAGIQVKFNIQDSLLQEHLDIKARKELLLIYKEVINNIIKHSGASQVDIGWNKNQKSIQLIIADNGFWKNNPHSSGTGLQSMEERASRIGATIELLKSEKGTTAILNVPIA